MTTIDASCEDFETYSPEMLRDYFVLKLNSIHEGEYNEESEDLHTFLYSSYEDDLYSFI